MIAKRHSLPAEKSLTKLIQTQRYPYFIHLCIKEVNIQQIMNAKIGTGLKVDCKTVKENYADIESVRLSFLVCQNPIPLFATLVL